MASKILTALFLCCLVGTSHASEAKLDVSSAWVRPSPPGAPTAAVYLSLHNSGDTDFVVMGIATPAAGMAEIHRTVMKGEMTGMVPVAGLIIAPGQTIALQPGGMHIMLMHLHRALAEGDRIPITLQFMGGGEQTFDVPVGEPEQDTSE